MTWSRLISLRQARILCATLLLWSLIAFAPSHALAGCTDMNGDTFTNLQDLNIFRSYLFGLPYSIVADYNCDTFINGGDVNIMRCALFEEQPLDVCCPGICP
jgi:hypothetical protein